jgi:hypothetical protein
MDFKSLISKLDSMEAPPQTPAAPTIAKAVQLNEDAQLRVLSGRTSYIEEAEKQGAKEKSSTGGTTDRSKPGVTTHTQNPDKDNAAPDSHAEPASKAKSQSAADKAEKAPALKKSKTGTWGMEGGKKFDNTKESIEPQFKSKFMKMVEAAKEQSEAEKAEAKRKKEQEKEDKKKKIAKIMDESVEEGEKKCPPMSHIKKMCEKKMSVAEICKMHPDCNQKELKQMVADCKSKLNEAKKPDDDNDGVPDWADEKKGEDDNAGKKTSGKKGMSAAQAKYFGKKKTVKESIENILSFKDMIKLVQESGGQQQIDAVDQELFSWAQRVAKQKIGEGIKADVYAGMVYERMGGVFEMYDVLSEDQK